MRSCASARAWTTEQKAQAITEASKLRGEQLRAYLDRQGIQFALFERCRLALEEDGQDPKATSQRIRALERELARKEKPLAEAAALLGCEALASTRSHDAFTVFERVFKEFGLPQALRTDNGVPFASGNSLFGLTKLSVWWLRLGIGIGRTKPGNPQQNGRHERMHLTLKKEATKPAAKNLLQQQGRLHGVASFSGPDRPEAAVPESMCLVHPATPLRPISAADHPGGLPPATTMGSPSAR
jgi:transposase InsO family protein